MYDSTYMKYLECINHKDRAQISRCQMLEKLDEKGVTANGFILG